MSQEMAEAQRELFERRERQEKKQQPQTVGRIVAKLPKANGKPLPPPETAVVEQNKPVLISDLDTSWHPKVEQAVTMAQNWQTRRRKQVANGETSNASMVLVASPVIKDGEADLDRTGYGCGKTHIALACLWSICQFVDDVPASPIGKFYMADDLVQKMDGESRIESILAYRKVWNAERQQMVTEPPPILVIDDVGTEKNIPFVSGEGQQSERHARYFQVINHCYKNSISVILTGNLTIDQLARCIGGRAWSRLIQMAPVGFVMDLTGTPDYRRKQGGR